MSTRQRIPHIVLAGLAVVTLSSLFAPRFSLAETTGRSTDHPFAMEQESALPGSDYVESIQKYSSIGADGDLRINIPLFTVPGKLPVPLNLSYKSGIKLDQSASWVGLGWNLGGWSVKRITVHGDDPAVHYGPTQDSTGGDRGSSPGLAYNLDRTRNRYFIPDFFAVTTPTGSYKFYNEGTVEEPKFIPIGHTCSRLDVRVSESWEGWGYGWHYPYDYFILTDSMETRYVFAQPMQSKPTWGPRWDFLRQNIGDKREQMANSEWLLTAILSHDYEDGGGDPLDPIGLETNDPRFDNKGTWVGFRYSGDGWSISNSLPNHTDTLVNGPWNCDQWTDHDDSTEITYLKRIVTPSTVVDFSLGEVNAYKTNRYLRSERSITGPLQGVRNLVLSGFRVFEYDGKNADPTGPELYAATFNYEDAANTALKQKWHRFHAPGSGCSSTDLDGEPTLRSVVIGTDNSYGVLGYAQEMHRYGEKKRFEFRYESVTDIGNWFDSVATASASAHKIETRLNWAYGQDWIAAYSYVYGKFPANFGVNDLENYYWVRNTVNMFTDVWGSRDFFGYHFVYPWAWSLTHLVTPEGLTVQYEYESDKYLIGDNTWTSGGCRVKSIAANVGSGDRDILDSRTVDISYGDGDDGIGYATAQPNNWVAFREGHSPFINYGGTVFPKNPSRFMGDNVDHVIQYPKITWEFPDNGGSAEYYYTTTKTVPGHRHLKMTFGDAWRWMNQTHKVNFGFWLDRSPLHGVPYKTIMKDGSGTEVYSHEKHYNWKEVDAMTFWEADTLAGMVGLSGGNVHEFSEDGNQPDTIAICYKPLPDSAVTVKDGVRSVVRYLHEVGDDGLDPYRVMSTSEFFPGEFKKDATWWQGIFRNSKEEARLINVYRHYPSIKTIYDAQSQAHSRRTFHYNLLAYDDPLYLEGMWESIPGNTLDWTNGLWTYFRDRDRYGNVTLLRRPDSVRVGSIYSYRGLEAEFVNIDSLNFAFFSAETGFHNQPHDWHLTGGTRSDSAAFTGTRSVRIDGQSTGLRVTMDDIKPGLYVVDCWAKAQGSSGYEAEIGLAAKIGSSQQRSSSCSIQDPYLWQHLVCSVEVNTGESLVCEASTGNAVAYFDDIRIYPAEAGVTTYAYDALMRPTSVSSNSNTPTRTIYNQYGEVLATADYLWNAISGSEKFFKNTDGLSIDPGAYQADLPNAVHSISGRGDGVIEDFSCKGPERYEITTAGAWVEDGKLWFESDVSDPDAYSDIIFPLQGFSDGLLAFDLWDGTETFGCDDPDPSTENRDAANLWFGFEDDQSAGAPGVAASISRNGYFEVWQYTGSDYTLGTMLASVDVGSSSVLCGPNNGKKRLGLACIGGYIYFFYNGECVYRLQDYNPSSSVYNKVKMRLKYPNTIEGASARACEDNLWIDNLVFYADPTITSSFVNSFGLVKQSQTLTEDGASIIMSGTSYTPDLKVQASFKPIELTSTFGYGQFAGVSSERCAFDYIDGYLVSNSMLTWAPGQALDPNSYLYSYYSSINWSNWPDPSSNWPDMTESGLLKPYTEPVYANDPLQRVVELRPPGAFAAHPKTIEYGHGLGVYRTSVADENGHISVTYQNQHGQTVAVAKPVRETGTSPEIDPLGSYVQFHHNILGYTTLIVQTEGQQIHRNYNAMGWLMEETGPDFGTTAYMYDQAGNLRFVQTASDAAELPDSRFQYLMYDRRSRLIETGFVYDNCFWAAPLRGYDSACVPDFPDTTSSGRLPCSYIKKTAEYIYDQGEYGRGQLTKATRYASGHPDSASWEEYVYDVRGRVVEKKQHVHGFDDGTDTRDIAMEYNNLGQVTRITYANGKFVEYAYNKAGQIKTVEDDDDILKAEFDYWPTGQVKTKTLGDMPTQYNPAQVVNYKYNARDWLVNINDIDDVAASTTACLDHFALELTYDEGAYQVPGEDLSPGYYNGNIASYKVGVSDDMMPIPPVGEPRVPRITSQSFAYDALDRLSGELFGGTLFPAPPDAQLYTYDLNGNLLSQADADGTGDTFEYTYFDGTNRVKNADTSPGTTVNFDYTPSGSMTRYIAEDMDLAYNYHEELAWRVMDGLLYRDTVRYWYNTSGQRIAKKFNYYYMSQCWNQGDTIGEETGRPSGLSVPLFPPVPLVDSLGDTIWLPGYPDSLDLGGGAAPMGGGVPIGGGYFYDCPAKDSTMTAYYYLGDDMLFDYESSGLSPRLIGNYVYANGERIASFEGTSRSAVRYYLTDHLGSVVMTVDTAGIPMSHNLYRPWGEKLSSMVASGTENQFQYTGQIQDEELSYELAYYGARYYDKRLKIFTSVDPSWMKDVGFGSYVYARNNPLKYTDPDGRSPDFARGLALAERKDEAQRAGHMSDAISAETFVARARGITLGGLQGGLGIGGSVRSAPGPELESRYVVDPGNPEHVIDMRHFLVVGQQGILAGLAIECLQAYGDGESAFDAQDFLSNALGADFFENYFDPDGDIADQLQQYFDDRAAQNDQPEDQDGGQVDDDQT